MHQPYSSIYWYYAPDWPIPAIIPQHTLISAAVNSTIPYFLLLFITKQLIYPFYFQVLSACLILLITGIMRQTHIFLLLISHYLPYFLQLFTTPYLISGTIYTIITYLLVLLSTSLILLILVYLPDSHLSTTFISQLSLISPANYNTIPYFLLFTQTTYFLVYPPD